VNAERRTKIVATLGPASDSTEQLSALIAAGMDAARLNLSHGSHADHAARAARVREVEAEAGRPIALIADLQGPKLRIGALDEPMILVRGETITITKHGREVARLVPVSRSSTTPDEVITALRTARIGVRRGRTEQK